MFQLGWLDAYGQERQRDDERASLVQPGAFDAYLSAVQFDEMTYDGQAQTQAGLRTRRCVIGLTKALEYVGQEFGADAASRVRNAQHGTTLQATELQADASVVRREFDGIGEEVPDHLMQAGLVAEDTEGTFLNRHIELDVRLLGSGTKCFHHRFNNRRQFHRRPVHAQLAGDDA